MAEPLDYAGKQRDRKPAPPQQMITFYRWSANAALILVCLIAIADFWSRRIAPGFGLNCFLYDIAVVLVPLAAMVVFLVMWVVRVTQYEETSSARRRWLGHASLVLVVSALACTFDYFDVPFRLAFLISRSSFERVAAEVKAHPPDTITPRTIGLIPIRYIGPDPDGVTAEIDGGGDIDQGWFIIWTLHPPRLSSNLIRLSLGHDWYAQHRRW
jgi:hypothetical protein